jgi:anti-sigma regulatory factor (Ser/Thr protein kinase)
MSITPGGQLHVVEIDIPARTDLVTVVRMIVAAATTAAEVFDGDRLDDLRWVTSEAVTNAIEADQRVSTSGRVRITLRLDIDRLYLTVVDEGGGVPDLLDVPDMDHPDRLFIEGGFGVPLMQHLSSGDVHFTSTPEGTTVDLELHR